MGRIFAALLLCVALVALPHTSPLLPAEASAEREYLVVGFDRTLPVNFTALVSAARGTVVRELRAIGVAVVRSSNPTFAATLGAHADIAGVALDTPVNWLQGVTDLSSLTLRQATGTGARPGPSGHLPAIPPLFDFQWGMRRIQADLAWTAGFQGVEAVKVAILDTGIDPGHVDTAGRVNVVLSADFTGEPSPPAGFAAGDFPAGGPFFPWLDYHFHGTHVAGIVAANGVWISGVARHVTLIAVKVLNRLGSGTFGGVISGIVHAADVGADVINMSLGAAFPRSCLFVEPDGTKTIFPSECALLQAAMNRAVNYASSKGVLVISAAGNSAVNADRDRDLLWTPAQSGNGIAVSATGPVNQVPDTFDDLAWYSNYGHSIINVAAPGGGGIPGPAPPGNVFDRVLSVCSRYSTFGAAPPATNDCKNSAGAWYIFARGTSMAAPHAAGVAALIDSNVGGAYQMAQLRSRLERSSDDLGRRGADPFYGHGRVNAYKAATGP